jgi:hypothetical protein
MLLGTALGARGRHAAADFALRGSGGGFGMTGGGASAVGAAGSCAAACWACEPRAGRDAGAGAGVCGGSVPLNMKPAGIGADIGSTSGSTAGATGAAGAARACSWTGCNVDAVPVLSLGLVCAARLATSLLACAAASVASSSRAALGSAALRGRFDARCGAVPCDTGACVALLGAVAAAGASTSAPASAASFSSSRCL